MAPVEDIVPAARACFAAKGFAGTSISDIEEAAGYRPRSGGLYRHYPSKTALLEAVIDAELAANRAAIVDVDDPEPTADPVQVLEETARRGLAQLDRQVDLMRILFRDLDQFPALLEKVRTGLTNATYEDTAARYRRAQAAGFIPGLDVEALTVISIAPLVDYKVKQHLLGYVPLDLDEDRLVAGWVQVFGTVFGVLA